MFLKIARWVPGTGIAFAVLVVVAEAMQASQPGRHADDGAWVVYYASHSHRIREEIGFILVALAGLCFLQFLGSLRGVLVRVEGEPGRITTAAVASGAAFITLAIAAHGVGTAESFAVSHWGSNFHVDPQTVRVLASLSTLFFVLALIAAAGMALAVATIALQWKLFPAWLTWLTLLAIPAGIVSYYGYPSLVVLLWIVLLSAWMLVPERAVT